MCWVCLPVNSNSPNKKVIWTTLGIPQPELGTIHAIFPYNWACFPFTAILASIWTKSSHHEDRGTMLLPEGKTILHSLPTQRIQFN